jgi:polyisoprenoid-binding protein YceI
MKSILSARTLSSLAVVVLVATAAACKDPAADAPKAKVGEAPKAAEKSPAPAPAKAEDKAPVKAAAPAPAPAAPAAGAKVYAFSQEGSKVEFVGSKVTGKHDGSFKTFSGKIEMPEGKPEAAKITVEIQMDSVVSDNEKLTGHLKSPDFFDVAKFPKALFELTEIKAGGDKGATHTLTGTLDLHGVKKSIAFPATVTIEGATAKAKAEFSINRKDFQIIYPGMPNDLIREDVLIKLDIQAKAG